MKCLRSLAAACALLAPASALGAPAALLIHGGPIYTGVAAAPTAEAVLVQEGRIAFVGRLAEARARAGKAQDVDLHGAAAYPGFVDAHVHLTGVGAREMTLNLDKVGSIAELVTTVRVYAAAHPGRDPIIGRGWIETHWPEHRFPTAADLDRISAARPIWLERSDGHAAVANSAALQLGHVGASTPDPKGGQILRTAGGAPTGLLVDNAMDLVNRHLPGPTLAFVTEALRRAGRLYASRGWTGGDNMSVSADDLAGLNALAVRGEMPIRVDNYLDLEAAGRVLRHGPYADPTGRIRVMGVKLYMDGALGSRGAALLAPYSDAPASRGLIKLDHAAAAPVFRQALQSGAQVAVHAIGDRANRQVLDWYEEAFRAVPRAARAVPEPRWRVEHAQILSPADLPRFAALKVTASMQPSHAIGDFYFAPDRLGEARLNGAYAWNSLLKSGAVVAAGSDAPVEVGDPRIEFYAAVWRHSLTGEAGPNWHLKEAVTRAQALRMLTWAPAYAARADRERGTLEVGKRADITAFSADLMTIPPAEILKAKPVLTVVDGQIVYQAP